MTNITILGASGFAGHHIAQESIARGHTVTAVSRSGSGTPGTRAVQGSVLEPEILERALEGADVVVGALSPRGDMVGRVKEAYESVADRLDGTDTRFIVVGGFGSLKTPEGVRIATTQDFPEDYRAESKELLDVLLMLETSRNLDWTYVSPAASFGAYNPNQTRHGVYRSSGDTPLFDEAGQSAISGPDFALAVVDEIERPQHRRAHVSFAY